MNAPASFSGVPKQIDMLAELIADGLSSRAAGKVIGIGSRRTDYLWRLIVSQMGEQAR